MAVPVATPQDGRVSVRLECAPLESVPLEDVPLERAPLRAALLDARGHLCAFFRTEEEEYRVLLPLVLEGFELGDRAYHVVDPARRADHVRRLAAAGIDVAAAEARGQLVLRDWSETYLAGGRLDQDRMLALFSSGGDIGRGLGFPRTRFVCHMEWGLESTHLTDELAVYEAACNLSPPMDDVVVCAYQLARWDARALVNVIRTHPLVIMGGLLHENPFFLPAAEALVELDAARASGGD